MREAITLPNGIQISIQASAGHYCSPRVNMLPLGQYGSVEVGVRGLKAPFASAEIEDLFESGFEVSENLGIIRIAGWCSWESVGRILAACMDA